MGNINEDNILDKYYDAILFNYDTIIFVSETDNNKIICRKDEHIGSCLANIDILNLKDVFSKIADEYVVEEERNTYLSKLSEESIWRCIDEGNTFSHLFNYQIDSQRIYYQIFIRREFLADGTYISFCAVNVDSMVKSEIKNSGESKRKASEKELAIINMLTEDFDFVGYVTLGKSVEEDRISQFRTSLKIHKAVPEFNIIQEPYRRFEVFANSVVDQEFREDFLKQISRKVVLEKLSKERAYYVNFIANFGAENCFYQVKFAADKDDDSNIKGIIIGIYSIDETIKMEKEQRKSMEKAYQEHLELVRSDRIIKTLASDYTVVYTANLQTDEVRTESLAYDFLENDNIFGLDILNIHSYNFRMNIIAATYVHPQDRQAFLDSTLGDRVINRIKAGQHIICDFRIVLKDEVVHMQLKIFPNVSESSEEIVIGFKNVENEYKAIVKAKNEENVRDKIIKMLGENYSLVCVVDIDSMVDTTFLCEEKYSNLVNYWGKVMPFSKRVQIISGTITDELERKNFIEALSKENIIRQLEVKDAFYYNYRSNFNNEMEYSQLKVVGDLNNEKQVVIGFRRIDEDTKKIIEMSDIIKKNLEIIDILASEYTALYFLDLNNDIVKPYSQNDVITGTIKELNDNQVEYSDMLRKSADIIVYEPDKEAFINAGSIENIKKMLSNQKSFTHIFRSAKDNSVRYNEMKYIKLGANNDTPEFVAVGFANRDEEILSKYVDNTIYSDYYLIFLADLKENVFRVVRDVINVSDEGNIQVYGDSILAYSNRLEGEIQNLWRKLANPLYLQEYLAYEDKKELSYKSIDDIWVRCTIRVIERENTIPVTALFTFSILDSESIENIKLNNKIAIQKAELEKKQDQLNEARIKAEEANRAKSEFLFNMSHDIRTPMNAIIGYTNMAQKYINNGKNVEDFLSKINISGKHLLNLVNDVLDMSKIESGNIKIEESNIDIADKISEILDMCLELASVKNIDLNIDMSELKYKKVCADALHINQILMNVLSNAIKYTNDCGKVSFTAKQKLLDDKKAVFTFIISDNGIGMTEEFLEHIYDNFSREKNSTMSGIEGTGLGMAIVKRLLMLMNGNINIDSKINIGTTVTIDIELKLIEVAEVENEEQIDDRKDELKGLRILVVEDNEMNREIMRDILEELGMIVECAEDGDIAVNKINECVERGESNYYKYILMDIQMPRMNGFDATLAIRKIMENEKLHIPIFAMTANAFEEDRKKVIEIGMDEHLSKPVDLKKIVKMMIKYL